jgi:hypothetical protein
VLLQLGEVCLFIRATLQLVDQNLKLTLFFRNIHGIVQKIHTDYCHTDFKFYRDSGSKCSAVYTNPTVCTPAELLVDVRQYEEKAKAKL